MSELPAMTTALGELADRLAPLGDRLRRGHPIGSMTTYRVGGRSALFIEANSVDDLQLIGRARSAHDTDIVIIGRGSNMLVADAGFAGRAVALGEAFATIEIVGTSVELGGSTSLPVAARRIAAAGLRGF